MRRLWPPAHSFKNRGRHRMTKASWSVRQKVTIFSVSPHSISQWEYWDFSLFRKAPSALYWYFTRTKAKSPSQSHFFKKNVFFKHYHCGRKSFGSCPISRSLRTVKSQQRFESQLKPIDNFWILRISLKKFWKLCCGSMENLHETFLLLHLRMFKELISQNCS